MATGTIKQPQDNRLFFGEYVPTVATPASSMQDYWVSFGHIFTEIPIVVASIKGPYRPHTEITGPNIKEVTQTGFTARVTNSYSQPLTPTIEWIAIGQ